MTDDSGPSGECPTCGAVADEFVSLEAVFVCNECNTRLDETTAVPIAELEQLADEWQGNLWMPGTPQNATFEKCAQDLQELIAEYSDPDE